MFLELWNTMLSPDGEGASAPAPSTPAPAPVAPAPAPAASPEPTAPAESRVAGKGADGFANVLMTLLNGEGTQEAPRAQVAPSAEPKQQAQQQPAPAPTVPVGSQEEFQKFLKDGRVLGKFSTVEDALRAYTELEKFNTRLAQRHGLPEGLENQKGVLALSQEQQKQILELQTELQKLKSGQPQQTEQQKAAEDSLDFPLSAEEMNDMLYSDPAKLMKVMQEHSAKAAQQQINTWQQSQLKEQQDFQTKVNVWKDQMEIANISYPDFKETLPEIDRIIKTMPELENLPNAIDVAYKMAKGEKLSAAMAQQPKQKSPDELLKDAEFRTRILNDPDIRQQFLKAQAEDIKKNRPPTVVSSQPGQIPAAPATEIRSTKEARAAATEYFRKVQQGLR